LAAIKDLLQVTLHEVLTSDESHQREWARLERVIVDALSDQTEPLLQVVTMLASCMHVL